MKNIFYKLGLVCVFAAALTSCDEDRVSLNPDNGTNLWSFNEAASDLAVGTETFTDTIEVGVTSRADVDRTIPINIDATSTATTAQYTIEPATLVIPAGEFIGKIVLQGNLANIPDGETLQLILTLDQSQVQILDEKSFHIVSIFRSCPTDLAGTYSVTTVYGFHDFLAEYPQNTMTVEVTDASGDNNYKVLDFTGGLYSTGPYATNYGTNTAPAAQRDLTFNVSCGSISWSGEVDPWGDVVPTAGAVNSYNEQTGVITISWTAVGYGENGVSVYTPQQ
ncbi:hypothetical protein FMM05_07365 [Flavobacterium zepuense]|uniref:Lipoprotein n=1 Tax=Flavobacterium zepuense TaxID=2593302 RepID=A0A552V3T6_9FLAO|nr:hypothetical protein [Flavobacterium zepuense]TRW25121.1 hypothetical protein FMM05_07365 [Flavobacterium zepuense]